MKNKVQLSVIIPAYLEEENLRLILPRLQKTLTGLHVSHEVLVVDTQAPMDATADVCRQFGAIHLLRQGGDHYGAAVTSGIAASKGHYVIFMDADGSHAPEFIPSLLAHAADYDVVIASRYVAGGVTENSLALLWMSLTLNVIYTLVLGLDCKDVSNSFKLYQGDRLRRLHLSCRHFDIVEEILVRYGAAGKLRIKEVPFAFKKRMFGETKRNLFTFVLSFAVTMLRLFWIRVTTRNESR